jgi:hypothetical protein
VGGYREYVYTIDAEGNVWIKPDGKAVFDLNSSGEGIRIRDEVPAQLSRICREVFRTSLEKTMTAPKKQFLVGAYPEIIQGKCTDPSLYAARQAIVLEKAQRKEQERQAVAARNAQIQQRQSGDDLVARKEACSSYGFTPGTDGHASCVMQLAIAAAASKPPADTPDMPTGNGSHVEALQEALRLEQARQRELQASIRLMELGREVMTGGTTPPQSLAGSNSDGTKVYVINGQTIICTTSGSVTNCN